MKRRRFKRIDFELKADVFLNNKSYKGLIKNISEGGLFNIVFSEEDLTDFTPGAGLEVKFQLPSGEKFDLRCNIIWLSIDTKPNIGLKYNMGLKIISPSQEYKKFVQYFK